VIFNTNKVKEADIKDAFQNICLFTDILNKKASINKLNILFKTICKSGYTIKVDIKVNNTSDTGIRSKKLIYNNTNATNDLLLV
jgi:DNA-binding winged helix-turn-helix (wHTH) protein